MLGSRARVGWCFISLEVAITGREKYGTWPVPIDASQLLVLPSLFTKELALNLTPEESSERRGILSVLPSSLTYDGSSLKASPSALDLNGDGSTKADGLESETLEIETEPETSDNSLRSLPRHSLYSSSSPQEQLFMEQFYAPPSVDGGGLFYGEKAYPGKNKAGVLVPEQESKYSSATDIESELLTADEAQEAFKDIQYAALAGSKSDVDADERRRFDLWIKFNPALFKLLEATYGLTRDVNYGSYL